MISLYVCKYSFITFYAFLQSVFTIVFFAAFHEFVKMKKGKYGMKNMNSNYTDGEMPLIAVHEKGTCVLCGAVA